MRISLLTLGSRGDVQPYLGLGVALARAGHSIRVAVPAAFEALVRQAGLEPFRVAPDPRLRSEGGEAPRWLRPSAADGARRLRRARLGLAYSGYLEASRGADVILHPAWLAPAARAIAREAGARAIPASLAPLHPTRAFPSPFVNVPPHPAWNGLSHRVALWLGRAALNGAPNAWRAQALGMAPTAAGLLPARGELCLYGFSRSLVPPPPDWPPGAVVTGPWWLDAPEGWRPPEELARFLDAPGKVVYIGFGSMMDGRPGELNAVVEAALRRVGCRAVVLAGPGGLLALPPSPARLIVRDLPLDWIFARVAAIVHHGGAGTAAQAARAGKPSVVVPFFADQFFWGARLHRAGGGPRPIPRRALTAGRLASAIDQALHDAGLAARAAALGIRVRSEAGLSTAVGLIEACATG